MPKISKDFCLNKKGWVFNDDKPKDKSIVLCKHIGFIKAIYYEDCLIGDFFTIKDEKPKFEYSYIGGWKLLNKKDL